MSGAGVAFMGEERMDPDRTNQRPYTRTMFELVVDDEFCAAHAIVVGGRREAVHGHNWRVRVAIEGDTLDHDGLLCDFHVVQEALSHLLDPWRNADLNAAEAFRGGNPTAEMVAVRIAEGLARRLPGDVRIRSVRVTEAPGCSAIYRPPLCSSQGVGR